MSDDRTETLADTFAKLADSQERRADSFTRMMDVLMRSFNPMPPSSSLMREFVAMEKSHEA